METIAHLNKTFNKVVYTEKQTKHREFENCSFINCDFSNGEFLSCTFVGCTFKSCNLSLTKFPGSQLDNVTFNECKLLGIDFSDCTDFLFTVAFEECILDCCSFIRKTMRNTPFKECTVKEGDFSECDLSGSTFQNTDLLHSVFNQTKLNRVDFSSAYNFCIDPELNNIKGAKFSIHGLTGLLDKHEIIIE